MELWHKKFGHANYKFLYNLSHKEIVRPIPVFEKENKTMCGDCKVGKQTRVKLVLQVFVGNITKT